MDDREQIVNQIIDNAALLHRQMKLRMHGALKQVGLSGAQAHLLYALSQHDHVPASKIATQLQLSPSAVSQTVEALVRRHFIHRASAPGDRRVDLLSLTEQGHAAVDIFERSRTTLLTNVLADLDETELRAYLRVQLQMHEHLKREQKEPCDE